MAWRCSGRSNGELISNLYASKIIQSSRVASALNDTDRAAYAPVNPYEDAPQPIGFGATISAPHMHAHALEALEGRLTPGANVLDIGCGSGYLTAAMARMVLPDGHVIGIDHIKGLTDLSIKNLQRQAADLLRDGTIVIVTGDGREGYPPGAPYDVIHVGAAMLQTVQPLLDQLKPNGILFVPEELSSGDQIVRFYRRQADGRISKMDLMGVRYVPMTTPDAQLGTRR